MMTASAAAGILASLSLQHNVCIATARLRLRPVEAGDLHAIHRMRLDVEVMRYMPGVETVIVAEESRRSIERVRLMMKEGGFSFAVTRNCTIEERIDSNDNDSECDIDRNDEVVKAKVIGFIGITSPPQIFYIFQRESWGRGYATEVLRAFLGAYWAGRKISGGGANGPDGRRSPSSSPEKEAQRVWHGEEELGDVLEAHVHDGNVGSEMVLRRCGFEFAWETVTSAHGRDDVRCMVYRIERPRG
ncbi:GNAT domain-containing protein [Colletotrichum phormii]|uniref:GNAT domain-containing protein n=1 Tax=Colletotrichum phormii TaxID=359342 RepID=A0AAI9ZLP0_9PEZI|nr:GNAT domain-containing protein [Colletotrichum phormii]KAK1634276.1 GNAT domain-containing protein [Colletotrichum phormii]